MAPHEQHGLPLGQGPRPADGDELAAALRSAATRIDPSITGLDEVRVVARMRGADIELVDADLTGLVVGPGAVAVRPGGDAGAAVPIRSAVPAVLHDLRIAGHPISVLGAAVDLDARVTGLPVDWIERGDGEVELLPRLDRGAPAGAAVLLADPDELGPAITTALETILADARLRVDGISVLVTGLDDAMAAGGAVAVEATATARLGFVRAPVRARAAVRADGGLRLAVEDVELTSTNVLASTALGAARGTIDRAIGDGIDLRRWLPAALHGASIRIGVVDGRLRLAAELP